jgi:hypothetical protein
MFLRRRLLSTAAAAAGAARGPPPIRVDLTESFGRGVFATRPVAAGELLHSAEALVTHPVPSLLNEVSARLPAPISTTTLEKHSPLTYRPCCA